MSPGREHMGAKRLVVTGASGFLGRELVPRLLARGVELLLVGRDPVGLKQLFPGCKSIGYDEISAAAADFDLLVHLAAQNNDATGTYDSFKATNVDLAADTYQLSRKARIRRFIYVSSIRALDLSDTSHYAVSKREAARQLVDLGDDGIQILYLPAVLGETLSGRLRVFSRWPRPLRDFALAIVTSLKPTVSVDRVASAVMDATRNSLPPAAPWIVTNGQTDSWFFAITKRSIDVLFAVSVLVLIGWLLVALGVAIRLQSPGPALFRQERVGRYQRTFTCYKLRTMHISTPNVGTHEVASSSVTRLGGFLRRTKLDELPQVLNILMNQMSLVGPRPCLPSQAEVIAARARRGVDIVKPGITGLSQIRGIDMSTPEALAASDADYLHLQSIILDGQILALTALGKGGGDRLRVA
ncbi:sugar transferase [Devosia sp. LjRoot16]|uniref:sugar transferase n=1 Tax=Devosia sp. LjRoot16 TaxID=3342271 RepID=UPI003ED0D57C